MFDSLIPRSLEKSRYLVAGLLGFGLLAIPAVPVDAQDCSEMRLRLWQKQGETWFEMDEAVEIVAGEVGHIYMHRRNPNGGHYSLSGKIGYPDSLGLRGSAKSVRDHLRMQAQDGDDRRVARIQLTAEEPGRTVLGYDLSDNGSRGSTKALADRCRKGLIRVDVLPRGGGDLPRDRDDRGWSDRDRDDRGRNDWSDRDRDDRGRDDLGSPRAAAEDLVAMMYEGVLRRSMRPSDPDTFAELVAADARGGAMRVMTTMTKSDEFRSEALKRTEEAHGRASLDQLRDQLLEDIYRDIYGYVTPSRSDVEEDRRNLASCLSGRSGGLEACDRLGSSLAGSRLFYERNAELIDRIRETENDFRWRNRN